MIGLNGLFTLLFSLFALGQMGRLSFAGQEINIYFYEPVLVITTLIIASRSPLKHVGQGISKWLVLWGAYMFVVLVAKAFHYTLGENIVALLYFARLAFYFIFFLHLSEHIKTDGSFQKVLHRSIVVSMILILALSLIQYFLYPNIGNLFYLGWDPHLYRMTGAFLEPSVAGSVYGVLLIYVLYRGKKQAYSVVFVNLLALCMFLTYSRGIYLGVLGTAIVYAAVRSLNTWRLIGFIGACLVVIILLPKPFGEGMNLLRTSTIESRMDNYQEAIEMSRRSLFLGIGYNHIRHERPQQQVRINEPLSHSGASFHSSFLVMLVTGGVIGLMLFIKVLVEVGRLHEGVLLSTVFLSIVSLTDNILLHPFILLIWLSIAAIPFRTAR